MQRRHHPLQTITTATSEPNSHLVGPRRLQYLGGLTSQPKVWLTMAQLAEHAPFPTAEAARKFVTRHPELPTARIGTGRNARLRVDRDTFDRFISSNQKRTA